MRFLIVILNSSRISVAYFSISGLDLLDSLGDIEDEREKIIDWIYSLQVQPNESGLALFNYNDNICIFFLV